MCVQCPVYCSIEIVAKLEGKKWRHLVLVLKAGNKTIMENRDPRTDPAGILPAYRSILTKATTTNKERRLVR